MSHRPLRVLAVSLILVAAISIFMSKTWRTAHASNVDVTWINKVNATSTNNTLTATTAGGHGESQQTIPSGNGSVKLTVNLSTQASFVSFGLDQGNFTGDYNEIDYGWLYYPDGSASYRINGENFGSVTVANGETLEVRINGTNIEWYRSGSPSPVYTTARQLSYPYHLSAVFDNSGQVNNAQIDGTENLSPPTLLTVNSAGGSQINLEWGYTGATPTGFKIERKRGSGEVNNPYQVIATVGASATTYTDSETKAANRTYVYRVHAYNSGGDGPASNFGQATTEYTGSGSIKTDKANYTVPEFLASDLPYAGGKFHDEVFGTEIMRVTDNYDGPAPGFGTYYSHWPTFNCDNTKLLIRKGDSGDAIIKGFDPVNFKLDGQTIALPGSYNGYGVSWESATWSNSDPDLIYTFTGDLGTEKLLSYKVSTNHFEDIRTFTSYTGNPAALVQMYMSGDDDVFCWMEKEYDPVADDHYTASYLVYKKSTDQVLVHNPDNFIGGINEVHIDKSGTWLHIVVATPQADGTGTRYLNVNTLQMQIGTAEIDHPPGHGDLGNGIIVGFDNVTNGISWRRLDDIHNWRTAFTFTTANGQSDWSNEFHGSLLADNEDWLTIGTVDNPDFNNADDNGLYEDEILQVALDGSGAVRRLCHNHTVWGGEHPAADGTDGYWGNPKPTISKNGQYVAFTSNWNNSGRYDLFIVKIPPAPALNPTGGESDITWTNLVNAQASGSALAPTAGSAHGESSQSISSGDGSAKFTVAPFTDEGGYTHFGLTNGTFTGDIAEVNYGWHIYGDGNANCRINGSSLNSLIQTTAGDTLEVRINGTTVEWYRNATLVYSLPNQTLSYPYRAAAVFSEGTSPDIATAQITGGGGGTPSSTWTSLVNATTSGSGLSPTAASAHAETSQSITSGNGSIKFTAAPFTGDGGYTHVGLINGSFTGDIGEVDYGWHIYGDGNANCRINGSSLNSLIQTTAGDTLEVRINGTTVEWYRNNTLVYSLPNQTLSYPYRGAAVFSESTSPVIATTQIP